MIYKEAVDVRELAPRVNEALKRLDIVCPVCKGIDIRNKAIESCSCGDTGKVKVKVKWKWQPKVGEWWVNKLNQKIHCIGNQKELDEIYPSIGVDKNIISILEWEEIERVLEKAGCTIRLSDFGMARNYNYRFEIWAKDGAIQVSKIAKSRQEAVMKAVIELGKELEG